jgi:hypothetical protein
MEVHMLVNWHGRAGRTQTGREEISRSLALVVEVEVVQEVEEIGRGAVRVGCGESR